jgi:hypothetical protein
MTTQSTHRTVVSLKFPAPVLALIALAKAILQALTGNNAFPTPDPPLLTIQAAITDLENAEAAVQTRAKGAVATRNEKRAALVALLQQLKGFVQKIADGDREHALALIQSAGMHAKKVPARPKRVFAVSHGKVSGSAALVTASAGHGAAYEWQTSADGGKTWQVAPATLQSRTTITGLQPGATYAFRYRPVTKKGDGDWSQPLSLIVQ